MEYEFEQLRDELKEALKNALNISKDLLQNDYLVNGNLVEEYENMLFEIPLELLKLIRKI